MSTETRSDRPGRVRRVLDFEITVKKIKPAELMNFCRHLSVFLTAGVPILEALEIIRAEATDRPLRESLVDIATALRSGESLSAAVAAHDRLFPRYFVNILRSAEETGQLAPVLGQLAGYLERDIEAKRKVKSALTYPAIVLGLALVSVIILVGFVLPRFVTFFSEYNRRLPLVTRILVSISNFLVEFGVLIVAVIAVLVLLLGVGTVAGRGRVLRDRVVTRLPLVGTVLRYAAVERFCRMLSSMVQAGVPLPVALELAADGAGNRNFAERIGGARQAMIEGAGLYGPLAATGMFPTAAVQMMRVGEETGTLEQRLDDVSNFYGKELEYRLKRLTDLLEPFAVLIVGVVVGFVAVAIISAIYGVFNGTTIK